MAKPYKLSRPGLGLSLYHNTTLTDPATGKAFKEEEVNNFPTPIYEGGWKSNTVTIRERAILAFINAITDKPEWERKVSDPEITAKWRKEIDEFVERRVEPFNNGFTDKMFEYALAELKDKAEILSRTGIVSVYDMAAAVFKSDIAVTDALRESIIKAVKVLEDVPEDKKDWHPGSDGRVLDLVHPSLWPLVYGKSRILSDRSIKLEDALASWGSGETMPDPFAMPEAKVAKKEDKNESQSRTQVENDGQDEGSDDEGPDVEGHIAWNSEAWHQRRWEEEAKRIFSTKFQWLPAEVAVSDDGKAKFTSYINNLHPVEHKELYGVLEDLLTAALPQLDATYDRVIQWNERLASAIVTDWGTVDENVLALTRIPCLNSHRECFVPNICKEQGWCTSGNRPDREDSDVGEEDGDQDMADNSEDDDDDDDDEDADADEDDLDDEENHDGDDNGDSEDAIHIDSDSESEMYDIGPDSELAKAYRAEWEAEQKAKAEKGEADDQKGEEEKEVVSNKPPYDELFPADYDFGYEPTDDEYEKDEKWFHHTHPVQHPEPVPYKYLGYTDFKTKRPFPKHKGLQIIVKLANIELTPEKPSYGGGSWHIEGQLNERIAATALYYYSSENITESRLAFKTPMDAEEFTEGGAFEYEQNDHQPFQEMYGAEAGLDEGSTCMPVGDVVTRQGRMLTFPNVLFHQVSPFELVDKTRPGHRKIVAFFLVDPNTPIISTANVPPQQMNWGSIHEIDSKLPTELAHMVYKDLGCPFGLDEAKALRGELIEERKEQVGKIENEIQSMCWNFCEH